MTAPEAPRFFARDELLGGLPGRRTSTVLYAIQGRTAQQVLRTRRAMATYLTERSAGEEERLFLDALSAGRDLPIEPTVQDLERYASDWAALVPESAEARASLAIRVSETYVLPRHGITGIHRALGLDRADVRAALERQGRPLDRLFTPSITVRERVRWLRSRMARRLENLPPVVTAFALTLTETVGSGLLALPIALAAVGPTAGIVVLVVFGLINLLTIIAIVEAITRSGAMRYGSSYFGRLVAEFLGRPGVAVLGPALVTLDVVSLVALLIGFGTTLGAAFGVSSALFAALLVVAILGVIYRESIAATVAFAILIGIVNVTLLLVVSALGLAHFDAANLAQPVIDVGAGGLIFGTVLASYFGHTSAANAAKVVLDRDPSGRALILGNVAAMSVVIALYCLVVFAISGAVPGERLLGFEGTALTPLAEVVGPTVTVLGAIYVTLSMGLGAVSIGLGLANQVAELLPTDDAPRQRGVAPRRSVLGDPRVRYVVRVLPILVLFPIVEWLLITEQGSFTEPIAILGALATPILGGAFPVLLLLAARRRGEHLPATVIRFVGHPVTVAVLFVLYLVAILVNGLVVSTDAAARVASVAVAAVMVVVLVVAARHGAFRPRAVLELRRDARADDRGLISVLDAGSPSASNLRIGLRSGEDPARGPLVRLSRFRDVRSLRLDSSGMTSRELEIWAHEVTRTGDTVPLDFEVVVEAERPVDRTRPTELPPDETARRGRGRLSVTLEPSAVITVSLGSPSAMNREVSA